MFYENYPRSRLVRRRRLQVRGRPRGLTVLPQPRVPFRTPEVVHDNSAVVTSLEPGIVHVVEWTGERTEQHRVFL